MEFFLNFILSISSSIFEKMCYLLSLPWRGKKLNISLKINKKERDCSVINDSFVFIDPVIEGVYFIIEIINNSSNPIRVMSIMNEKDEILVEFEEENLRGYALKPADNYSNHFLLLKSS